MTSLQDQDMTPPGYETVLIEPNRTGLNYPLYMKVEEKVGDQLNFAQDAISCSGFAKGIGESREAQTREYRRSKS